MSLSDKMIQEIDNENYCKFCKTTVEVKICYAEGYTVCLSCGVVLQDRMIDPTAEYRTFDAETRGDKSDPCRVGFAYDYSQSDGGLDLIIEGGKKSVVFDMMQNKMKTIGTSTYKNSQLSAAFFRGSKLIKTWAAHLNFPDKIIKRAQDLFQTLNHGKKSLRGLSVEIVAATLFWLACKQEESQNLVMSFAALAEVCGVPADEIKKCYHKIIGDIPAEVRDTTSAVTVNTYSGNIVRGLNMSGEACAVVERLEKGIIEKGFLEGKNPRTIGAIAVHTFCLLSTNSSDIKNLKEIVAAAEIGEATVKKNFKDYLNDIVKIVPEWEGMKQVSTLLK